MNTKILGLATLLVVVVMMFGLIGSAAAQDPGDERTIGDCPNADRQARIAEVLGITLAELEAYLEEGLTVPEIAAELGVELPERPDKEARQAALAEALGISVEALETYQNEGLTISEIAAELGLDLSQIELPRRGGRVDRGGCGFGSANADPLPTETVPQA